MLKVEQLLMGTIEDQDSKDDVQATVTVGSTSIIGRPPTDCRARDIVGTRSFEKIEFNFYGTTGTSSGMALFSPLGGSKATSTQRLHFSSPSLKMGDVIIDSNGQPLHDSIVIVAGNCLFSDRIMRSCNLADGTIDLTALNCLEPTTYEIEYIARAAPAIADLACTILLNNKAANITTSLSINFDIPNWHYYRAVEEKLGNRLCTANDALLNLKAVESVMTRSHQSL